jgi:hypothetical protein
MKELRIDSLIPDKLYLKLLYRRVFDEELDIDNPKSFNEKLQWLKIYNRDPLYTTLVDKYAVKDYIKNKIKSDDLHIIKTLGVWNSFDEIDFEKLPEQFVLKTTHDSGTVCICKERESFDFSKAKKQLTKSLKHDYYLNDREWPYKSVPRRIIAEEYMVDESGTELKDYKFFCFNGEPKLMFVATDRPIDTRFDYFDIEFNHLPFIQGFPNSDKIIERPKGWSSMVEIARKLSEGIPHVRIDLYDINGKIYFGEYTFFHNSGFVPFYPKEWDYKIGELLELPQKR